MKDIQGERCHEATQTQAANGSPMSLAPTELQPINVDPSIFPPSHQAVPSFGGVGSHVQDCQGHDVAVLWILLFAALHL